MEWTSSFPIEEFLLLSVGLTVKLLIFLLTGWSILGHHSWAQSFCGRFGRQGLRGACGGVVAPTARSATKQWMVRRSSLGEHLVCWEPWVAWIYRWTSCWFVGVLMVQWSLEVWSQNREKAHSLDAKGRCLPKLEGRRLGKIGVNYWTDLRWQCGYSLWVYQWFTS